jgi:hypothetical protein
VRPQLEKEVTGENGLLVLTELKEVVGEVAAQESVV